MNKAKRVVRTVVLMVMFAAIGLAPVELRAVGSSGPTQPAVAYYGYNCWYQYAYGSGCWGGGGGSPSVSTSEDYYLSDGTYLGSHSDSSFSPVNPNPYISGLLGNLGATIGWDIGWSSGSGIASWIAGMLGNGVGANYFGYYLIAAGPWAGAALGLAVGFS